VNRLFFQLVVGPKFRATPTDPERVKLLVPEVEKFLEIINNIFFQKSDFVAGEEFSVADIALGILIHSIVRCPEPYKDISKYPNILEWWKTILLLDHFNKLNELAYGKEAMTPRRETVDVDTGNDGILLVDVT